MTFTAFGIAVIAIEAALWLYVASFELAAIRRRRATDALLAERRRRNI